MVTAYPGQRGGGTPREGPADVTHGAQENPGAMHGVQAPSSPAAVTVPPLVDLPGLGPGQGSAKELQP